MPPWGFILDRFGRHRGANLRTHLGAVLGAVLGPAWGHILGPSWGLARGQLEASSWSRLGGHLGASSWAYLGSNLGPQTGSHEGLFSGPFRDHLGAALAPYLGASSGSNIGATLKSRGQLEPSCKNTLGQVGGPKRFQDDLCFAVNISASALAPLMKFASRPTVRGRYLNRGLIT